MTISKALMLLFHVKVTGDQCKSKSSTTKTTWFLFPKVSVHSSWKCIEVKLSYTLQSYVLTKLSCPWSCTQYKCKMYYIEEDFFAMASIDIFNVIATLNWLCELLFSPHQHKCCCRAFYWVSLAKKFFLLNHYQAWCSKVRAANWKV